MIEFLVGKLTIRDYFLFVWEAIEFLMQVGAIFALGPGRIRRVSAKLRRRGYREV